MNRRAAPKANTAAHSAKGNSVSAHHPTPASALTLPQKLLAHTQEHPQRLAQRVKRKGVWRCYTWSDVFERTRSMALGAAAQGLRRGDAPRDNTHAR